MCCKKRNVTKVIQKWFIKRINSERETLKLRLMEIRFTHSFRYWNRILYQTFELKRSAIAKVILEYSSWSEGITIFHNGNSVEKISRFRNFLLNAWTWGWFERKIKSILREIRENSGGRGIVCESTAFCNGEEKWRKESLVSLSQMHRRDRATLLMGRRIRDGKALMIIVGRIMVEGGGTRWAEWKRFRQTRCHFVDHRGKHSLCRVPFVP